ncbi:MAG: hypothetical protein U9R40_02230 [Synergistota bacterium]|nr:hypothetical protein [Synergistota bacterium]
MGRIKTAVLLLVAIVAVSSVFCVTPAGAVAVRVRTASDVLLATGVNGSSKYPALSENGLVAAFYSDADTLVPDAPGFSPGLFLFVFNDSGLSRVASGDDGSPAGVPDVVDFPWGISMSGEGNLTAFVSHSASFDENDHNNAPDVFVFNRASGEVELVSVALTGESADGHSFAPAASGDGRYVAFMSTAADIVPGDTNGCTDIFIRDLENGATERISMAFDGTEANGHSAGPAISEAGRYVAFSSEASNLVPDDTTGKRDIFVADCTTGEIIRVSVAGAMVEAADESFPFGVSISGDGTQVAFLSKAPNLVPGDTNGLWDIFVRDTSLGITTRGSLGRGNAEPARGASLGSLSRNGRHLAFASDADTLVPGDTNHGTDVFVRNLDTGEVERVSVAENGDEVFCQAMRPAISADGSRVAFTARFVDLATGEPLPLWHVFVRDMQSGWLWLLSAPFASP